MNRRHLIRFICILGLTLTPSIAWAHAVLKRSEPTAGARVASPDVIRLWFSERPEVAFTAITVTDASGRVFPIKLPQPNASNPLEVSFVVAALLPAGKYSVAWRTVASDGHPYRGSF